MASGQVKESTSFSLGEHDKGLFSILFYMYLLCIPLVHIETPWEIRIHIYVFGFYGLFCLGVVTGVDIFDDNLLLTRRINCFTYYKIN